MNARVPGAISCNTLQNRVSSSSHASNYVKPAVGSTARHSALYDVRTTAGMQCDTAFRSGVPEVEQRMEQLPSRISVSCLGSLSKLAKANTAIG